MTTRYFFYIVLDVVVAHVTASQANWDDVTIPSSLREVDAATFEAVVDGSTANDDGTYTPPPIN